MAKNKEIDIEKIKAAQLKVGIPLEYHGPIYDPPPRKLKIQKVKKHSEILPETNLNVSKKQKHRELLKEIRVYRKVNSKYFDSIKEWVIPDKIKKARKKVFTLNKFGYSIVKIGSHYELEHKLVVKEHEKIISGWDIHHCDRKVLNNSFNNLIQIPKELHDLIHVKFPNAKDLPSKKVIEEYYLPEFLKGNKETLLKDYAKRIQERRLKRKPRSAKITKPLTEQLHG